MRHFATTMIVTGELLGAATTANNLIANAARAAGLDLPGGDATISESVKQQDETNQQYVLDQSEKANRKRLWGQWQEGE